MILYIVFVGSWDEVKKDKNEVVFWAVSGEISKLNEILRTDQKSREMTYRLELSQMVLRQENKPMKKSSGSKTNGKNDGVAKYRERTVLDRSIEGKRGFKTPTYLCF